MSAFNRLLIITTGGVGLLFLAVYEFSNRLEIYNVADPLDTLFGNSPRGFLMHVLVYGFLAVGIGLHFQDIVRGRGSGQESRGEGATLVQGKPLAHHLPQNAAAKPADDLEARIEKLYKLAKDNEEADILDWSL